MTTCTNCGSKLQTKNGKCIYCGTDYSGYNERHDIEDDYDSEDEGMSIFAKIFIGIAISAVLFIFVMLIDSYSLQNKYFNKLYYGEDSTFTPPPSWEILSDGKTFIARNKVEWEGVKYLSHDGFGDGIDLEYPNIYTPDKFVSVNNAKAAIKYYLFGDLCEFKKVQEPVIIK